MKATVLHKVHKTVTQMGSVWAGQRGSTQNGIQPPSPVVAKAVGDIPSVRISGLYSRLPARSFRRFAVKQTSRSSKLPHPCLWPRCSFQNVTAVCLAGPCLSSALFPAPPASAIQSWPSLGSTEGGPCSIFVSRRQSILTSGVCLIPMFIIEGETGIYLK
ncbi:hypothetical protein VTK56DRAFT_4629 [Thermocarpiscus australiensis]